MQRNERGQTEAITKLLLVAAGIAIAYFAINILWGQVQQAAGSTAECEKSVVIDASDGECQADIAQMLDRCVRKGRDSKRDLCCYLVNLQPIVTGEKCAASQNSCVCPELRNTKAVIQGMQIRGLMNLVGSNQDQLSATCTPEVSGFCITKNGDITKAATGMRADFYWKGQISSSRVDVKISRNCALYTDQAECENDYCKWDTGACKTDCTKYANKFECSGPAATGECKWTTSCVAV